MQAPLLSAGLISSSGDPLDITGGEHSSLEGASKAQVVREVFSLTDVVYCKNKQLQAIQWVPQRKVGVPFCPADIELLEEQLFLPRRCSAWAKHTLQCW